LRDVQPFSNCDIVWPGWRPCLKLVLYYYYFNIITHLGWICTNYYCSQQQGFFI